MRCVKGRALDVAVDILKSSPTNDASGCGDDINGTKYFYETNRRTACNIAAMLCWWYTS